MREELADHHQPCAVVGGRDSGQNVRVLGREGREGREGGGEDREGRRGRGGGEEGKEIE